MTEYKKHYLESLSPKDDLYKSKDGNVYQEYSYYRYILDDSLTDKNNTNIAISGKYGSGKSSLIYSYIQDKESEIGEKSILKINFANLNKDKGTLASGNNAKLIQKSINKISLSIINQIIYQIKYSKIPLTYFKTKQDRTWFQNILIFITVLLGVISATIKLSNYTFDNYKFILFSFLILCSYFVFKFIRHFDLKKIKFSFKNIEANINYDNDDFFEKYVDEIIYLFTSYENKNKLIGNFLCKIINKSNNKFIYTLADKIKKHFPKDYILVIEDLDRFDDTEIFRKLKNLNIKLNQKSNNHWVFLYLIRDNLFESSTERTKFFDLIIPVIPFITASNSYDKMKELFKDEKIDKKLLIYVSQFIYDYRLLLNIRNEYTIFYNLTSSVDPKELFALIAYKNIFPNEFDNVQNGHGMMEKIVNQYRSNIGNSIKDKEQKLDDIRSKALLKFANDKGVKKRGISIYSVNINDKQTTDEIVKNNEKIIYENSEINYDDLENNSAEYDNYLNSLDFGTEKQQLEELQKYEFSSINEEVIPKDQRNNKEFNYLFNLIKMGYITIDYLNTINLFYGDIGDEIFIHHLYENGRNYNVDLHLNNIIRIVNIIKQNDNLIKKPQILNTELFRYTLDREKDLAHKIISTAKNVRPNTNGYHFLEHFISEYNNYFDKIYKIDKTISLYISDMVLNEGTLTKIIEHNMYYDDGLNNQFILDSASSFSMSEILDIINTDNVRPSLKKKMIDYMGTTDFSKVNNKELWNDLIKKDKIAPTFDNVMTYYNDTEEISKEFYKFINKVDIPYKEIEDESEEKNFIISLIFNDDITLDKTREIVTNLNLLDELSSEDAIKLNNDKFQLLLDRKLINVSDNNILNYIASHQIEVNNNEQYSCIIKNLDSKYDDNNKVTVSNKKLLNIAVHKYDPDNFRFVSRRLDYIPINLLDYLKHMKDNLDSYTNDLNKLIRIINKEKGCFNMRVKNDPNGIIINIAEFMKFKKYISNYELMNNNKIKFYK